MAEAARIMREEERGSPGWIDAAAGLLEAFDAPEFTHCTSCETPGAPATSSEDFRLPACECGHIHAKRYCGHAEPDGSICICDDGPDKAVLLVLAMPNGGRVALCHTCVEKIGFPWPGEDEP